MHPLFADVRKLLWTMAAWLLAGLFVAGLLVTAGMAGWGRALVFALPVVLVFGFLALSAYFVCRSLPMARRRWPTVIAVFGGASLVSGFAWLLLCQAWNLAGASLGEERGFIDMTPGATAVFFSAGAGLYLLSLFAHDVLIAFETVREAAEREAESRVLARDAELQMLRTQINPHFLFNSLNSISALTSIDAKGARDMTISLAQFFRQTLSLSEQEKIPLADEIALCESFLAIEKTRFGRKLGHAFEIDDAARGCRIPPMILQPLLENAIKHGLRHLDDGGVIAVRATVGGDWLHIAVANPTAPDDGRPAARAEGNGIGLRNIRQRLAVLYGERARIGWERGAEAFTVEIALPAERGPA